MGVKKVFILNDRELYGKGIADVFEATAKKIRASRGGQRGIDWKQPDQARPHQGALSGVDLVYMGGVIETGAQVIIRQMKEVGPDATPSAHGADGLLGGASEKTSQWRRPPTCG
jgi:branched-chain amino acid transport system substrate-binding protein